MSKIFINPDKVEGLCGSFQKFETKTREIVQDVDNYIRGEESYYDDVRKKMRANLEYAERMRREAVTEHENAKRELDEAIKEAQRRMNEKNDDKDDDSDISGYFQKIPSLKMREKEALDKVHECAKEVKKYEQLLRQCESLIAIAGSAVGQYRESERTMNSILNDHTPAILIKLQIAVEKGRAVENVRS